mgnify:CR=1 FL=1|jgi:hypothetical protein
MPLSFKDFWNDDGNRVKYQHIKPEMIHQLDSGKFVGWDAGNKCFRYVNEQHTDFQGSPSMLPRRKQVSEVDFIKAYYAERSNGGSLESLIQCLGYYKNSIQGLRARISEINGHIKTSIERNESAASAKLLIASQRSKPTMMLYGLTSAHTLRGAPRTKEVDYDAIYAVLEGLE